MFKNNNRKIIRKIARDKMKSTKGRYWSFLIAIIMTATLLTSTLTVGASLVKSMEYTTMRQVGTKSHGGYKYLTPEEYNQLEGNPDIKKSSYMQTIGIIDDISFKTRSQQVFFMDEQAMDLSFMIPLVKGEVPAGEDEVLVSTLTLDMLGLPHEVGVKIQVNLDMDGVIQPVTWSVSGIYEGDHLSMADIWVVSEVLANNLLEGIEIVYDTKALKYTGLIQMGVMLDNSNKTFEKLNEIAKDQGLENISDRISVNWAYMNNNVNNSEIYIFCMLLLLLMFSGYLVIYNIFSIGIIHDIQFYGMLKTVGCTKKQLKRVVLSQGFNLTVRGIPIGLMIGYMIGRITTTYMINALNINEIAYSINPLIFVFGAVLTLATVYFSARKPARIASKVSPIEAIKTTEVINNKKKITKASRKKIRRFSIFQMAKKNIMRYKKKAIIVVLSMSISLVLLQTVTTSSSAVDMDKMIDHMIAGDYTIGNTQLFNYSYDFRKDAIDEGILNTLAETEGVVLNKVYGMNKTIVPSERLIEAVNIKIDTEISGEIRLLEGKQEIDLYGVDGGAYKYLEAFIVEGELDIERFNSGDGIVISKIIPNYTVDEIEYYDDIYKIGDLIDIPDEDGINHSYEVMAFVGEMPYYLYDGNGTNFGINVYMSSSEFEAQNEAKPVMLASVEVKDEYLEEVALLLEQLGKAYPEFAYKSRSDYIDGLSSYNDMMKIIGYSLSGLLGLIAVLNFINTFISDVISRRKELAMLQSIGMTSKQVLAMLLMESGILSMASIISGFVLGGILSKMVAQNVMFSTGEISLWPLFVISPILILALLSVPIIIYNNLRRESLVERIRVVE